MPDARGQPPQDIFIEIFAAKICAHARLMITIISTCRDYKISLDGRGQLPLDARRYSERRREYYDADAPHGRMISLCLPLFLAVSIISICQSTADD